jgi:hypothetical protein
MLFGRLTGGSYSDLDTFDTARKRVITTMIFDWKQYYVDITISGLDQLKNGGAAKIISHTDILMDAAAMSGPDYVGDDLYLDGSGNQNKAITGLRRAYDSGATYADYGGITRTSGAAAGTESAAASGNVDTTGGAFSLSLFNTNFGTAQVGREKPDLVTTTQAIWNLMWDRVQPAQRFQAGDSRNQMASVGFDSIVINGADIVVDSKVPSGQMFMHNTKWIKMIVHSNRMWSFSDWKYPTNNDSMIGQLFWAGEIVVQSPRLQQFTSSIT